MDIVLAEIWGVRGFLGLQIPLQPHMLLSVKSFNVFVGLCVRVCISAACVGECVCVPL